MMLVSSTKEGHVCMVWKQRPYNDLKETPCFNVPQSERYFGLYYVLILQISAFY